MLQQLVACKADAFRMMASVHRGEALLVRYRTGRYVHRGRKRLVHVPVLHPAGTYRTGWQQSVADILHVCIEGSIADHKSLISGSIHVVIDEHDELGYSASKSLRSQCFNPTGTGYS